MMTDAAVARSTNGRAGGPRWRAFGLAGPGTGRGARWAAWAIPGAVTTAPGRHPGETPDLMEASMGRRPTRQLTWSFILRTFKRVDMIAARYSSEAIAKALVERGVEIGSPDYLRDIWEYMRDLKEEAGGDIYAHPNGNCPQCGHDIGRDHNGARYCSTRCRQRAWRERRAVAEGRNAAPAKRRRRFNRDRGEMKRRARPLDDVSIAAAAEINVTPVAPMPGKAKTAAE